jgi:hypothetical protein
MSPDKNTASVRSVKARNQAEQSGFAASTLSQQNESLSLLNGQGAILENGLGTKRFGDTFQSNHRFREHFNGGLIEPGPIWEHYISFIYVNEISMRF